MDLRDGHPSFPEPGVRVGGYLRPTWRQAISEYLPLHWRGERADQWIGRSPLILVLIAYAVLVLLLQNTAYIDEARNINAGRDYLGHWLGSGPALDHSRYFAGAPFVYPVIAGGLDRVGGLALVRGLSLICLMVTIAFLQIVVTRVSCSHRVGLLAASAFAFTAPVVFLGALGTFDALCLMLIALGAWTAVTRDSSASALTAGCLFALAVVVRYASVAVVAAALVVVLVASVDRSRRRDSGQRGRHSQPILAVVHRDPVAVGRVPWDSPSRAAIVTLVTVAELAVLYLVAGDGLREGAALAVTSWRRPVAPQSATTLLGWATLDIGLLSMLAVGGVVVLVRTAISTRAATVALSLVGFAMLLPGVQILFGDAASFDEHNAYSAFFLAPVAGWALATLSRGLFRLVPTAVILLVLARTRGLAVGVAVPYMG